MLFIDHKEFVWGLIASLYAANLFALLINMAFIPAFLMVLEDALHDPGADHLRAVHRRWLCADDQTCTTSG